MAERPTRSDVPAWLRRGTGSGMSAYTVRQVLDAIGTQIERRWPTPVEVEGELAQVSVASSGHAYLTLREAEPQADRSVAQLSAVCWRSTWQRFTPPPAQGARVIARGRLGVWTGRGQIQLQVLDIAPAGEGALAKEIARRRARLEADGLLDPRRKRPLPPVPSVIGVATSLRGAALQDFLEVSRRRWPAARVLVAPCVVQGDAAPPSVVQAVELLLDDGRAEVIIVTRGGGGKDDLLAFQDEGLARFLAACPVPVVAAIGHQVDQSLVDLVVDLSVATPTEAAVRVLPDASARAQQVDELALRLDGAMARGLMRRREAVTRAARALRHPSERLLAWRARTDDQAARLRAAMRRALREARARVSPAAPRLVAALPPRLARSGADVDRLRGAVLRAVHERLDRARQRVRAAQGQVDALGPQRVLARGYAVVTGPAGVVHGPEEAPAGVALTVRVARGAFGAVSTGDAS